MVTPESPVITNEPQATTQLHMDLEEAEAQHCFIRTAKDEGTPSSQHRS